MHVANIGHSLGAPVFKMQDTLQRPRYFSLTLVDRLGPILMSDELKDIYAAAGLADRFYEGATPIELWRAQSDRDFKKEVFIMLPHPGYVKKDTHGHVIKERLPDVQIVARDGKQIVRGCRCTQGDYRGISVFDAKVTWLGPKWVNYRIPKETPVPENLAVTRDHSIPRHQATHYTLAPKDDMTLELFVQSLKIIASRAEKVD
jgi:hypothetical protein